MSALVVRLVFGLIGGMFKAALSDWDDKVVDAPKKSDQEPGGDNSIEKRDALAVTTALDDPMWDPQLDQPKGAGGN